MCKNTNKKTFKFKVEEKIKENEETIINIYRFKTTKEITERFNIPRNSIYYIMNEKPTNKYNNFKITKINEPAYKIITLDN